MSKYTDESYDSRFYKGDYDEELTNNGTSIGIIGRAIMQYVRKIRDITTNRRD
ncbi:hypothetical protein AGMMS49992_09170 [Clostridia bacterium]|nr:hypothetical protein AGMMS49992_09170 [Clostridia bacterium]